MPVSRENLATFVDEFGPVKVVDSRGTTKTLDHSSPDSIDLYDKSDRVFYRNQWCSRQEFESIVEGTLAEYWG